jgi:Protein of unknown function (DUF2934)
MERQSKTTTAREGGSESDNRQKVAALAYEFWQARGCPEGTPEEDWFRAELEIAAINGKVAPIAEVPAAAMPA